MGEVVGVQIDPTSIGGWTCHSISLGQVSRTDDRLLILRGKGLLVGWKPSLKRSDPPMGQYS
jgi:hypothetical protein